VLYLNDGQNLFDAARAFAGATWRVAETIERLVTAGRHPASARRRHRPRGDRTGA
jgi:predicted alpha/beta superfamily hydrolase